MISFVVTPISQLAIDKLSELKKDVVIIIILQLTLILEGCAIHLENEIPGMSCRHHKVSC